MQIILLSGGSGKRLWPLSNNVRSKQFLRLLETPDGKKESMVQRVARQMRETGLADSFTVATSATQLNIIKEQLGDNVNVVTEPERRDTFPAIALASAYLAKEKRCDRNEVVAVMPCDPYTENEYFNTIIRMGKAIEHGAADLVLMGIKPSYPSTKFGYIVPEKGNITEDFVKVSRFTEKPNEVRAKALLMEGACWNGGVFAFRLGYMLDIIDKYVKTDTFKELRDRYSELPKISFDYEVVEKARSVAMVPYRGKWIDLGTWNALTEELPSPKAGNVVFDDDVRKTSVINELDTPVLCVGTQNLIVAANRDGILVADRESCEKIKPIVDKFPQPHKPEESDNDTEKEDGYISRRHNCATKRYCQMLQLKPDSKLIKEYRHWHSREGIWPEIIKGIKSVGILEMEIYIEGTQLFMIVETPVDFDWDKGMTKLSTLPRQAEWEEFVGAFQKAAPGSSSSEKWHLMERMFHLYD